MKKFSSKIDHLFSAETYDELIDAVCFLRSSLKEDVGLVEELAKIALDASFDTHKRSLALDLLASAKLDHIEKTVLAIIRDFLESKDSVLQYHAVAASSFLPQETKAALLDNFQSIYATVEERVRGALDSFFKEYQLRSLQLFVKSQKNLDPSITSIVDKHFWELL